MATTGKTSKTTTKKKPAKKTTANSLLIVESPAKAKAIQKYLGRKFIVKASVGHVKDLPVKSLGVDVENGFKPEYVTIKGKGSFLKDIKKISKEVDNIYLAPDPDREGEVIAWHIANEVAGSKCNIHRVLFNEITPDAVRKATQNPQQINIDRVNAQQARRVLDRVVGYQISPILWSKIRRGLSAGRVQSVAVRLICDREAEIKSFKSREYWSITGSLLQNKVGFKAKITKKAGEELVINNQAESDAILEQLSGEQFIVTSIEKKKKKRNPVAPFITSKLQQEAARKLKFSSKKTMMLAQQLYEGIDVGSDGQVGLITYMRTDSTRISDDSIAAARAVVSEMYGPEYLPAKGITYKNKKRAQDAHEAIRPTYPAKTPDSIAQYLDQDQLSLYRLIWNRFIAAQVKPAIYDIMTVDIKAGEYNFHATGSLLKFDGFMRVYTEGTDILPAETTDKNEKMLPAMETGQLLECEELVPQQHFTQPPPRFNEPMLIKVLEEEGIGRPSTYATIISTIQSRNYVEWNKGKFIPSELGSIVNEMLVLAFPEILNVKFTAKMEESLDFVEEGKQNWNTLISDFYGDFKIALEKAKVEMKDIKKEETPTDIKCEKCGKIMNIKWGKNGKFLACSGYPECKSTTEFEIDDDGKIKAVKNNIESDQVCDKCGRPMIIKNGRFGRFLACSGYPECKSTKSFTLGINCPEDNCKGELTEKKTKKGKFFYSCNQYPDCKFASWDKPVKKTCPQCNAAFMVEKNSSSDLLCIKPECGYKLSKKG